VVARKHGFFAELQHQQQVAARRQQQQQRAASREQVAAQREAERTRAQAQQLATRLLRASAAEQKAAEREMKRLHVESMEAEALARTTEVREQYDEIDSLLAATLTVDDYVELEELRQIATHPEFTSDYDRPSLLPPPLPVPPEPQYTPPPGEPTKIGGLFGARKRYSELEAEARRQHDAAHAAWETELSELPGLEAQRRAKYDAAEQRRVQNLDSDRQRYLAECEARDREVSASNQQLDTLIQNLAYGVDEAVHEYVGIVLSNSVYPKIFAVAHEFEFRADLKELSLTAVVPPPDAVPRVKEYKYIRAKDEITSTSLPQRDVKERYRNAVAQVAVRSIHEVFEADRAGWIQSISLTVATDTVDQATGLATRIPLIAVAADRTTFAAFELDNVVPTATLQHLGAQISKNPSDLDPIDLSKGVRGR
jgi:restriction system protein